MPDGEARPCPLLVWGFDGTVVDTFDAIRDAVDAALGAHGLRPVGSPWVTEVILRSLVGLSLDRVFGRLVSDTPPDPETLASLVESYDVAFRSMAPDRATLSPGVASLLAELDREGVVSVIASSDGNGAELLLERFGIRKYFSAVISDADVERHQRKPDAGMVLRACAMHGVAPHDAVVIGDSVFDVDMGQAAGADTIWVTWGNQSRGDLAERQPTHLVQDAHELRNVLRRYIERGTRSDGGARGDGEAGAGGQSGPAIAPIAWPARGSGQPAGPNTDPRGWTVATGGLPVGPF